MPCSLQLICLKAPSTFSYLLPTFPTTSKINKSCFPAERRKQIRGQSPLQDENPDDDDYMDDSMKESDKNALNLIILALKDYETDMNNFAESLSKTERIKAGQKQFLLVHLSCDCWLNIPVSTRI